MLDANKLTLEDGAVVQMIALNQSHTYEGLIEGVPTKEMNNRIVAAALSSAKELWNDVPQVIPPKESPISLSESYPFGTPARIPEVLCVSRWRSQFESRGELDGWAECTIIWFQTRFALPIDRSVIERILAVNWNAISTFYEL